MSYNILGSLGKGDVRCPIEGNLIHLKKYVPQCVFCGEAKGVTAYEDKNICAQCISEIK